MRLQSILVCILIQLLFFAKALEVVTPHPDEPSVPEGTGSDGEGGTSSSGEGCLGTSCEGEGTAGEPGEDTGGTTSGNTGAIVPGSGDSGSAGHETDGEEVFDALETVVEQILSAVFPSTASASSTPTITAAPRKTDPYAQACVTAHNIYSACSTRTSGFLSAENNVQASCLCYQTLGASTRWAPSLYDNVVSSCDTYLGTVTQPYTLSSAIAGQMGLCPALGDVRATPVAASSLSAATASYTVPASTGLAHRNTDSVSVLRVFGIAFLGLVF
ncbi:MAG: hypothetical protein Q9191_004009 [Dirinaria sp. TL-2023a]